MRTDNYALKEEFVYYMGSQDSFVLPQGAFVCPISDYYVPKHIKEDKRFQHTDMKIHTFCYTRFGILPIPKRLIEAK